MATRATRKRTPRIPFGRHKGEPLAEMPAEYLAWLVTINLRPALREAVEEELASRARQADLPGVRDVRNGPQGFVEEAIANATAMREQIFAAEVAYADRTARDRAARETAAAAWTTNREKQRAREAEIRAEREARERARDERAAAFEAAQAQERERERLWQEQTEREHAERERRAQAERLEREKRDREKRERERAERERREHAGRQRIAQLSPEAAGAAEELIKAGVKALAGKHHPDTGGSHEAMVRVNQAAGWLRHVLAAASRKK